jgi:CheY-like chemotaxis protein
MTSPMSPICFANAFAREARRGTYVLHFAASGEEALDQLSGEIRPELIVILSDIDMPGWTVSPRCARSGRAAPISRS